MEVPNFFPKTIRKCIVEDQTSIEQLLQALVAHKSYFGRLSFQIQQKAVQQLKQKLSFQRMIEQIRSNLDEDQLQTLVKSARVVN